MTQLNKLEVAIFLVQVLVMEGVLLFAASANPSTMESALSWTGMTVAHRSTYSTSYILLSTTVACGLVLLEVPLRVLARFLAAAP